MKAPAPAPSQAPVAASSQAREPSLQLGGRMKEPTGPEKVQIEVSDQERPSVKELSGRFGKPIVPASGGEPPPRAAAAKPPPSAAALRAQQKINAKVEQRARDDAARSERAGRSQPKEGSVKQRAAAWPPQKASAEESKDSKESKQGCVVQ